MIGSLFVHSSTSSLSYFGVLINEISQQVNEMYQPYFYLFKISPTTNSKLLLMVVPKRFEEKYVCLIVAGNYNNVGTIHFDSSVRALFTVQNGIFFVQIIKLCDQQR